MTLQRRALTCLGLAIALAGLISLGTNVTRGADLGRYVSSDFCGAIVIHPDRIAKSTLAEAVKSGLPKPMAAFADPASALVAALSSGPNRHMLFGNKPPRGMDMAKLAKLLEGKTIVRIVILIDPLPSPELPAAPGIIVQFGEDIDGDGVLSAITSEWEPAEANGAKYKKLKSPQPGKPDLAALAPDARMLIAGVEGTVVKMLTKDQGGQPLLKQLQHTSFKNDIVVEFLAEPIFSAAKGGGGSAEKTLSSMGGPMAAKVSKEIKSVSVKLNFSGKTLFHAEVLTDTADTATMYAAAARKALADAKPKFEEAKKQPLPFPLPPPAVAALSTLGDEVFAGLTVKNDGAQLVADLAMPASLPDALKLVGQLVGGMQGPPGGHPR